MRKLARPIFLGLVLLSTASNVAAKSVTADSGYYTAQDKEYYLTADELFFIRPGLDIEVVDFTIPADRRPEVTFTVKDPGGLGLDTTGVSTPGPISVRYMLAYIPMGQEQKVNYHGESLRDQPPADCPEALDDDNCATPLGGGMYFYKFTTVLPEDFEQDATHTFTLVARRDLRDFDLDRYVDNDVYHFVPSGAYDPVPREIVTTETCNGRCHDPLAQHGGNYIDTQVCTQCHNPGLRGKGMYQSFNVMVHRVHEEAEHYPTSLTECQSCHTGGTPTNDYPLVADPPLALTCDLSKKTGEAEFSWSYPNPVQIRLNSPDGKVFINNSMEGSRSAGWIQDGQQFFVIDRATGETIQQLTMNTTLLGCQGEAPGSARGRAGLQHTNWLERPTRAVCGSCHTEVNFETGEGHSEFEFPVDNDEVCAACHRGYTGKAFDRSVWGAHVEPYRSGVLPELMVEFIDVMDTAPGENPTVIFDVGTKFGRVDPSTLDRLRFTITGPNEDFSFYVQEEDVVGSSVPMNGYWAYTFATALPLDAEGSFTVSSEGRNEYLIEDYDPEDEVRDVLQATLFAFPVTAAAAKDRRIVVGDYNCESCHTNLAGHGGGRTNVQYCNTCHRPEFIAELEPAESVHMKYMVHKIHRGAELENGYVVVRSRGTFDFSDVEYPGDLRNCGKCHVNGSHLLPLPDGLLATTTPQELLPETLPIGATCLSCHDSIDAKTHTVANTTFFGESCGACHAEGAAFSVSRIHSR